MSVGFIILLWLSGFIGMLRNFLNVLFIFQQFSPTSEHILLAYGRRHSSLLRSIIIDEETAIPIYTILEVDFLFFFFFLFFLFLWILAWFLPANGMIFFFPLSPLSRDMLNILKTGLPSLQAYCYQYLYRFYFSFWIHLKNLV